MEERILYKSLVVGVIVLFIGVGIQPAIATVEPENIDVEYYDVTTEFIGLNKEYTTQLTKEQFKELDALFDSIYERLNLSTSIKDSVEIYKDAVVKLNNLGLLGDVGIQETEELVTSYNQNPKLLRILERGYNNKKGFDEGSKNSLCLIAGRVMSPYFIHPIIYAAIFQMAYFLDSLGVLEYWDLTLFILLFVEFVISWYNPFCFAQNVLLYSDYGTIISFGLRGLKYWHGGLDGMMKERLLIEAGTGIIGFTGIKIQTFEFPTYFIGGALHVFIEDSS